MDTTPPSAPQKRHRKTVFIFAGLLLLLLAGFLFSGSWLRALINDKGASRLGRPFSIEGPLTLHWQNGNLHVHAEKLRLANAPGEKEPDMLAIGGLDVTIDVWRLFESRLALPDLTIDDMTVILEKNDADHANWNLPFTSQGKAVTNAALPQNRHQFPVIGALAIHNSTLIYRDDAKKLEVKLKVDSVAGSSGDAHGHTDHGLTLTGTGTLQDKAFTIDATGGSIAMLRDTKKDYPLRLTLKMGATSIAVNGSFSDPVKMTAMKAQLDLKGDNLANLFYLTGIPLPPTPPYSLSGTLSKQGDVWAYNGFKGKVGNSDLSGDLTYDASGKRGLIKADLVSERLDIADLSGFVGAAPKSSEAETAQQKADAAKQAASSTCCPMCPSTSTVCARPTWISR